MLNWLNPLEVDYLIFGFNPDYRYNVKLSKLGDTPFVLDSSNLDIEDGIFIPISKINELRRKAISELTFIRKNEKKEVVVCDKDSLKKIDSTDSITFSALETSQMISFFVIKNAKCFYI